MPAQKDSSTMSAFERKRLENIEANRKILDSATVVAKKIAPKPKPTPTKSATRKSTRTPVKRESARPTRMSSRLAGLDADNETLKRKLEVDAKEEADKAKAKKLRVTGDLSLGDILVAGKKFENGLGGLKGIIRGAQPGVRTFTEDDVKETTDKGLKDLRLRMSAMKLYEGWAPNGKHFLDRNTTRANAAHRHQDHTPTSICVRVPPNGG